MSKGDREKGREKEQKDEGERYISLERKREKTKRQKGGDRKRRERKRGKILLSDAPGLSSPLNSSILLV